MKRLAWEPTPPSFPLEAARTHPRYRYCLELGAQCEHDAEHDGPHIAGSVQWHDPPKLYIGGAAA